MDQEKNPQFFVPERGYIMHRIEGMKELTEAIKDLASALNKEKSKE